MLKTKRLEIPHGHWSPPGTGVDRHFCRWAPDKVGSYILSARRSHNERDRVEQREKPFYTHGHWAAYWWISQRNFNCYPSLYCVGGVALTWIKSTYDELHCTECLPTHRPHLSLQLVILKTPSFGPLGNQARAVGRSTLIHRDHRKK